MLIFIEGLQVFCSAESSIETYSIAPWFDTLLVFLFQITYHHLNMHLRLYKIKLHWGKYKFGAGA